VKDVENELAEKREADLAGSRDVLAFGVDKVDVVGFAGLGDFHVFADLEHAWSPMTKTRHRPKRWSRVG